MPIAELYRRQVGLLVRVIPLVAAEACFALKGGTAINLFVRDMPRLSADIDLTYLPVAGRAASLKGALCRYPLCLPRPRTCVNIRAPDTESDKSRRDNELKVELMTLESLSVPCCTQRAAGTHRASPLRKETLWN